MHPKILNELILICKILEEKKVQYLMVGGFAVGLHCYSRMTSNNVGVILEKQDFDFWYNPTYENYYYLLEALGAIGHNVDKFKKEQTLNPFQSFFKFNLPNYTLDFLPIITGLEKFSESYYKKETLKIEDIEISFICFDDLIINKHST